MNLMNFLNFIHLSIVDPWSYGPGYYGSGYYGPGWGWGWFDPGWGWGGGGRFGHTKLLCGNVDYVYNSFYKHFFLRRQ